MELRGFSSVGRASVSQTEGHEFETRNPLTYAVVAQLIERNLAKVEVAGLSPAYRSKKTRQVVKTGL